MDTHAQKRLSPRQLGNNEGRANIFVSTLFTLCLGVVLWSGGKICHTLIVPPYPISRMNKQIDKHEHLNINILDVELNAMILAASHTDRPHLVERLQHLRTSWQVSWDWSCEVT